MRKEPELLVPISEVREAAARPVTQPKYAPPRLSRFGMILTRIWIVLAALAGWFVFISGGRQLHFTEAVLTIGGFAVVWHVVVWIFAPPLPPNDEQQ